MRKKIVAVLLITIAAISLQGCSFSLQKTCKESGCDETEIYEDGYCKYHYLTNTGKNILKDLIN